MSDDWTRNPWALRYLVTAFQRRRGNNGRARLYRHVTEHATAASVRQKLQRLQGAGCYLYAVGFDSSTLDVVGEFGDESIEDQWVDAPPLK